MKVIFLADVPTQKAKRDDIREVSDGYARNFLFPRKLAQPASAVALATVTQRHAKQEKEKRRHADAVKALAGRLKGLTLSFTAKAHEGKLYGGIGAAQIVATIRAKGIVIDEDQLILKHPIKMLGEHTVMVRLGDGVEAEVSVRVSEEMK